MKIVKNKKFKLLTALTGLIGIGAIASVSVVACGDHNEEDPNKVQYANADQTKLAALLTTTKKIEFERISTNSTTTDVGTFVTEVGTIDELVALIKALNAQVAGGLTAAGSSAEVSETAKVINAKIPGTFVETPDVTGVSIKARAQGYKTGSASLNDLAINTAFSDSSTGVISPIGVTFGSGDTRLTVLITLKELARLKYLLATPSASTDKDATFSIAQGARQTDLITALNAARASSDTTSSAFLNSVLNAVNTAINVAPLAFIDISQRDLTGISIVKWTQGAKEFAVTKPVDPFSTTAPLLPITFTLKCGSTTFQIVLESL